MIGKTISHYRIIEKIGSGGMGVVYKAEDTRLKRTVALKFLSAEHTLDESAKSRFMQEAQAASALQHHNICTIHEVDRTADGQMFLCMDYYPGDTLKSRVEQGPLAVNEAVDIALQTAEGLAKAHQAGMVHRDIKPANIAVTGDGVVKILDFGLAKLTDGARMTRTGTTVGTVAYMSPEQARGEDVGAASDVWSAGAVLFELLTGRPPFQAEHEAAMIYAIINEPHEKASSLREDVPPKLSKIVDKALAKNPGQRYSDASELANDLADIKLEMTSSQRIASVGKAGPSAFYKRSLPIMIPVALAALVVFAIFFLKPLLFEGGLESAPRPIAVISFENQTGESQYDYLQKVIPNLLITSLEQSKYLSVITWERMHDLLVQAGWEDVEVIDKETGFEVCRLDGIDTIIFGTFSKAGDVFVTDVKVLDVRSKELLKSASAKGTGVESILASQIDEIGKQISRGVGLPDRSAETPPQRIADVTTKSMNAYHFSVRGREQFGKHYFKEAAASLETAVQMDSTFAVAWLYLARSYARLRDSHSSIKAYTKAKELAASAPEKDRLYIEALYANNIERNEEKYISSLKELTVKYPKEKLAHLQIGFYFRSKQMYDDAEQSFLTAISLDPYYGEALNGIAYAYAEQEKYEQAIQYLERYAKVRPDDVNPLDSMAEIYFRMGRLDEASAVYKRAHVIKPGFGSENALAYICALKEDYSGAAQWMDTFIANAPSAGLAAAGRFLKSFFCSMGFEHQDALTESGEARSGLLPFGQAFSVAGTHWIDSWIYLDLKEYDSSRNAQQQAISLIEESNLATTALWISSNILSGYLDLAENSITSARAYLPRIDSLLALLPEKAPTQIPQKQYEAGLFRAEVLLAEDRIDDAITEYRRLPEVSIPSIVSVEQFTYNFPRDRDVLARAYVRKGAIDDAIQEYERLVTFDPASSDRRLINPKFHYRLGKLYEQQGIGQKAVEEFQKFVGICGDAQPPLTEVEDARRRLNALSSQQ